jgi:hypothetical protein
MILFDRYNFHSWRENRRKMGTLKTHLDFVCITVENAIQGVGTI